MNKSKSIFIKKTREWVDSEVSFVNEVLEYAFENLLDSNELEHEVSVLLTNNNEIRELNKKYRNIDKSTNVLSFSIANANISSELKMIGDIVISKEKILSEAKEQNKTFMSHLAHMVIHGFLHLLDFTHDSRKILQSWKKKKLSF
tara:strand:- start:146 stop:580 length:435 start_codon:yes stop_codon:yes gene_type:complete